MRFVYCPKCGTKAVQKVVGDEGEMPWCESCQRPLFDMFSTCVILLAVNQEGECALLRQGYISHQYHNLVSGYIVPGESAEECARRELEEELGLVAEKLEFVRTWWYGRRDMLMIGFFAQVSKGELRLSGEVEEARWVPVQEALDMVHPEGSVSHAMVKAWLDRA